MGEFKQFHNYPIGRKAALKIIKSEGISEESLRDVGRFGGDILLGNGTVLFKSNYGRRTWMLHSYHWGGEDVEFYFRKFGLFIK